MSITYSLRRWMDPDFHSASERAQMERVLEQAPAPVPGGDGGLKVTWFVMAPQVRQCRLCGRQGKGDTFCLSCLADTME